jgi:hypothetical protein
MSNLVVFFQENTTTLLHLSALTLPSHDRRIGLSPKSSFAYRLTESVRWSQSQEAKDNLKGYLSAIKASSDDDLTVRLVIEVCERELA